MWVEVGMWVRVVTVEQQAKPTGQTVHSVCLPSENVPRGHAIGASDGLGHCAPAGHGAHELSPSVET